MSEVGQQDVQEVTGSTSTVSTTTTQWTWTPADNNNNDYDSGTVYSECPTDMETHCNSIYIFQNVRPVLKTLFQDLSDGTLTLSKIKLRVILNLI